MRNDCDFKIFYNKIFWQGTLYSIIYFVINTSELAIAKIVNN